MNSIVPPCALKSGQEWFWSPTWQDAEREVEEQLAAGQYETFATVEEFIASLESAS
jgi:hypothetical protein